MANEIIPLPLEKPDAVLINKSLELLVSADLIKNNGRIFKSNCTICNADCRQEVEKMYEDGKNIVEISDFLKNKKNITLKTQNIKHHMVEHFKNMERTMLLLDYCENLASMMERRHDRIDDVEMLVNVARLELARAISMPTNGDGVREKLRSDMIDKAMRAMADHIRLFNEMEDDDSKLKAFYTKVISVWRYEIENAKTDEEKKIYLSSLEKFQSSLVGGPKKEGAYP